MPKIFKCPVCGCEQRMQNNAKYCSNKCRQKAFRDAKKHANTK